MDNIERSLGRIEGKLDGITTRLDRLNGRVDTHETTIDKIDRKIAVIQTKAATFGTIAGAIVVLGWEYIRGKI